MNRTTIFRFNNDAVLGLPMRLLVSLIIGSIALVAILTFMVNPCLFPRVMIVSTNPILVTFPPDQESSIVNFSVKVTEHDGHPLSDAKVLIQGLGGIGSGTTNQSGKTSISLSVHLDHGMNEGYLDVSVNALCHQPFVQESMIKIIRAPEH